MRKHYLVILLCFGLLALPIAASAQEDVLYGCTSLGDGVDSRLYIIDPTTGDTTLVGDMGEIWCTGLAFSPDGTLFAMGWAKPAANWIAALYTVNPSTGAATLVGYSPHSFADDPAIPGISFRSDGTLFGYLHGDDADGLGTVDTASGAVTEIGGTGVFRHGNGIAFSSADILFHSGDDELNTLNQATGAATLVASLTFPILYCPAEPRINAMDFDNGGTLFGSLNCGSYSAGAVNYLATINTTTGVVTNIGGTVDRLDGIAFGPRAEPEFVPEAGTMILLGSGLAGLAGYASLRLRARRKREE